MSLRTGTLLIAPPSSSQADQNKIGGPEKSLFERSLGVGREERPPIAVVIQLKNRFYYFLISVLKFISVCEKMMNVYRL